MDEKGEHSGICHKILQQLQEDLAFTADIKFFNHTNYGSYDETTKNWTGLIGELQAGNADMAAQTITVTAQRGAVVNFTAPFMMSGIAAMMKAVNSQGGKP